MTATSSGGTGSCQTQATLPTIGILRTSSTPVGAAQTTLCTIFILSAVSFLAHIRQAQLARATLGIGRTGRTFVVVTDLSSRTICRLQTFLTGCCLGIAHKVARAVFFFATSLATGTGITNVSAATRPVFCASNTTPLLTKLARTIRIFCTIGLFTHPLITDISAATGIIFFTRLTSSSLTGLATITRFGCTTLPHTTGFVVTDLTRGTITITIAGHHGWRRTTT